MQFNKGDIVTCTDDDMYGITDKDVRCTVLSYSPELHDSNCHGSYGKSKRNGQRI